MKLFTLLFDQLSRDLLLLTINRRYQKGELGIFDEGRRGTGVGLNEYHQVEESPKK